MGAPQEKRATILVVDDAAENITLLTEILKDDYRVLAARSGGKALQLAAEKQPDLIMLDVMMPEMDGHEVCRRLKSDPKTSDIPVFFVTAMNQMEDETEGLALGAADYLTKPLWPPLVKKRVRNQMDLLEAHSRIHDLNEKYSSYLSPELSASIKSGHIDENFQSTRKKLTVFFSDIAGFTRLVESLDPVIMTGMLNEYFEAMNTIVARYGGTLDKYIGDAILVFFGDPQSRGEAEDAKACAGMALEMQNKLADLRRKWKTEGKGKSIRVRMGISTGYATVGNYGSRHKLEYTIVGPPVNLASRMQAHAEVGTILVSEETWRLIHEDFEGIPLDPVEMKGISSEVQPYKLAGTRQDNWYEFESGDNWLHINPRLIPESEKAKLGAMLDKIREEI